MPLASYTYLLAFFPLLGLLHWRLATPDHPLRRQSVLLVASLAFCALGGISSLVYLCASSTITFAAARMVERRLADGTSSRIPLALGIGGNVLGLAVFKYTGFVVANLGFAPDAGTWLPALALPLPLPLGISFITFQQIAYLVDAARGDTRDTSWLEYACFVSFFPKLVAGPLADPKATIAQLRGEAVARDRATDLGVGLTLLATGLFKKVMIADELGQCADAVFGAAGTPAAISVLDGWLGALAYTLQLYFDFSGYSDMAIGSARCLGIRLPLNFDSPYQAINISDFWRRWHITLGRFLTRYLYTPLATPITRIAFGRSFGPALMFGSTVALPTLLTFSIAGLWHGAGWTFVCFGALHGVYLTLHQGWRELRRRRLGKARPTPLRNFGAWLLTFIGVLVAFVYFRAPSMHEAWRILAAMLGVSTASAGFPASELIERRDFLLIGATAAVAFLAPNSSLLLREHAPALELPRSSPLLLGSWRLQPRDSWAFVIGGIAVISIAALGEAKTFIYYAF